MNNEPVKNLQTNSELISELLQLGDELTRIVDSMSMKLRDNRIQELESVLHSVNDQFEVYGNQLPDGFDSRVFRWVKDALAGVSPSRQRKSNT